VFIGLNGFSYPSLLHARNRPRAHQGLVTRHPGLPWAESSGGRAVADEIYQRVKEAFQAAMEHAPSERSEDKKNREYRLLLAEAKGLLFP